MKLARVVALVLVSSCATSSEAAWVRASTAPAADVQSKVVQDAMQNIQIHDTFAEEQKSDEKTERIVKANKDMTAFLQIQTGFVQIGPDENVAKEVAKESRQNIQIHDTFAEEQKSDEKTEQIVKANKDMTAFLQIQTGFVQIGPDENVAKEVAKESTQNFQIHDSFADDEKKDKETESQVKANRDMTALLQTRSGPDVATEVAKESTQNFQIHDSFANDEKKDKETENQVKANKDMTALLQTGPDVANEVAKESLQNLQIHDGFAEEQKKDAQTEAQIKANKDLTALQTGEVKASNA